MKSTEVFYFSNSSPESTTACRWMAAEMENNLNIFVSSGGGGKKFNFPQKDTEKVFPSHLVYWRPKNNICRLPLTLNHWHNPFVLAPSSSLSPRKFSISISPSCVRYAETRDKILWQFLPSSESHRDFSYTGFSPSLWLPLPKRADKRKSREKIFCNFLFHFIFFCLFAKRDSLEKRAESENSEQSKLFLIFPSAFSFYASCMTCTFSSPKFQGNFCEQIEKSAELPRARSSSIRVNEVQKCKSNPRHQTHRLSRISLATIFIIH